MGERLREEPLSEEEDLLARSIKKAKGMDSIEEVMDESMVEKTPENEKVMRQDGGI